ncbi:MAG: response regulator [Endomicrobiales bacterium]
MDTAEVATAAAILVVTQELHSRSVIGEVLQKDGHELSYSENAAQAIELCKNKVFDILIADYNLSDMTGIELVKSIATLSLDITPVIISDVGSLEIALEGMKLGVHDYMMKPINTTELKRNVNAILAERTRTKQGAAKFQDIIARIVVRDSSDTIVIVPSISVDDGQESWFKHKLHPVSTFIKKVFKFIWDVE